MAGVLHSTQTCHYTRSIFIAVLALTGSTRRRFFRERIHFTNWPQGAGRFFSMKRVVFGLGNRATRVVVLGWGQTRTCRERRAEAVMSVVGVTSWHRRHVEMYNDLPPDTNIVLGAYSLEFVREAAGEMEFLFYMSFKPFVLTVPLDEVSSSMLPFGSPGDSLLILHKARAWSKVGIKIWSTTHLCCSGSLGLMPVSRYPRLESCDQAREHVAFQSRR